MSSLSGLHKTTFYLLDTYWLQQHSLLQLLDISASSSGFPCPHIIITGLARPLPRLPTGCKRVRFWRHHNKQRRSVAFNGSSPGRLAGASRFKFAGISLSHELWILNGVTAESKLPRIKKAFKVEGCRKHWKVSLIVQYSNRNENNRWSSCRSLTSIRSFKSSSFSSNL